MSNGAGKWAWVNGEWTEIFPDADVVALIRTIERFRSRRPSGSSPAVMAENLIHLRRACDLLELEFAARAAEFAATDESDRQGSTSSIHWIRHECNMSTQAAVNAVDVGEQAAVLPQSTGWGDDRERDRRLADALVELAGHRLDMGELPQRAGQRPHLQVTASVETLQGADGAPAGELEFSAGPIAGATVQRLACDAGVTRVLLGPDSAVVDVGRSRRLPSAATRRALAARDRGCVWPGCERPASWTSAHHLQHWAQGGNTDMANLVLVCYRHHWKVHEGGWQLVRGEDQAVLAVPPSPGYVQPVPGYLPRACEPDTPVA